LFNLPFLDTFFQLFIKCRKKIPEKCEPQHMRGITGRHAALNKSHNRDISLINRQYNLKKISAYDL